jgi:hypothetical protein
MRQVFVDGETASYFALRHTMVLQRGGAIDPRRVGTISTAVGEAELDRFGEALHAVLARSTRLA